MPPCVIVRVTGRIGLDDADRLLGELEDSTGLRWREEPDPDAQPHLSTGLFILVAVVSGSAANTAEEIIPVVVAKVRETVKRWQDRWLDPPGVEVEVQAGADPDPVA